MDKRLQKIWKRVVSVLMTFCLTVGLALSNLSVAYAAGTELPDESNSGKNDMGACESTAYKWIKSSGTGESGEMPRGSSYRFDVCGLRSNQSEYIKGKPEGNDPAAGLDTTYWWQGYATCIKSVSDGTVYKANSQYNGGVESVTALGVELKIKLSPSPDNKYIYADYYVYDTTGQGAPGGREFWLGSGTDVKINGDDKAILSKNTRGFHMQNRTDHSTFDCITHDPNMGITGTSARYVGPYGNWGTEMFKDSPKQATTGEDSGLAYSWNFKLRPFETVHRRVAFAVRDTSYYVSNGKEANDSNDGTYTKPFATIDHAVNAINGKKGYVYVMDDYDIGNTITISGEGTDTTIIKTNFNQSGVVSDASKTLKHSGTGPMFKVTDGAILRLTDITLDGKGTARDAALLSAESGRLEINSGAEVTNCRGNASSKGSAVDITGSGSLSMNMGKVSGNTSEGKGAIYFDSTGTFNVQNGVQINDNVNENGKVANVYLPAQKVITVEGDLGAAKIGVTTATLPDVSAEGAATAVGQEVKVAVPKGTPSEASACPFVDNFTADQKETANVYIYPGTVAETMPEHNDVNAVLRRNGLQINCVLKDKAGLPIPGASYGPFTKGGGENLTLDPPPALDGYTLDSVVIDQPTGGGLTVTGTPGEEGYGRITGLMPGQDVVVEYTYKKGDATITFNTNGGMPQPDTLTGIADDPVPGLLPSISKYGYKFRCWSTNNDWVHPNPIESLPTNFPAGNTSYYAVYDPDSNQSFNCMINHSNVSGTIEFGGPTEITGMVETSITDSVRLVNGYIWSDGDSGTIPAEYNYTGTSEPVGTFDSGGNYAGKMPGQDTTVNYRYKVDRGVPKLALTAKYESKDNPPVSLADDTDQQWYPEDPINLVPKDIYGYKCVGVNISYPGQTGEPPVNSGYVYTFKGDAEPGEDNHFAVGGLMPNQPMVVTYQYETTIPGYEMTVKYEDSDTHDGSLRNITDPSKTSPHKAGSAVGGSDKGAYKPQYGYQAPYASDVKPDGAEITVDPSTHQWGGVMPNDDAQVTYKHRRDPSKWAQVTYKPGTQNAGTLRDGDGVSPDVGAAEHLDGSFKAQVLKNDGTHGGYTLQQIIDKKLMPKAVLNAGKDKYYQFDPAKGWFIDENGNGLMDKDSGEKLLPPDYQFEGDTTVTAYYGEKEGAWVTATYVAGGRVAIADNQPKSYHTTSDKTWADIPNDKKPEYTCQTNYLDDGWWVNGERLDPNAPLVNGDYIAQCRPDPAIFGTAITAPNAAPRLNTDGRGRITAYGIIEGYQYILVDAQGKVQAVEKGKLLSDRAEFNGLDGLDGLYPGAHYTVYEALGSVRVHPGDTFDSGLDGLSGGTDVLIPVVDTNYRIKYDNDNEGKTILHIEPADRQSDYAVLDSRGQAVHTPQTDSGGWQRPSGNPGKMDFTGLDYNAEYTVVARPTGQTGLEAESLLEDGSVVTTDPGGELELANYIIKTPHGIIESVNDGTEVGLDNYNEAHKGKQVKIKLDTPDSDTETFDHWEFTIGRADSLAREVKDRELAFTMPDSNLVVTAIYKYHTATGSPSNATVTDEVRGGSREEMSLDPDEIADLEDSLTTPEDETLMGMNKQRVSYKVVYRKNAVRATESNAIKGLQPYSDHQAAFKGAWGLDVSVERYVNGRKVGMASPSDANFNTYVQLGKDDVDMMDYNLYQAIEAQDGQGVDYIPVSEVGDTPEETGGLFTFRAEAGCRYVMVYSRAYHMYFRNDIVPKDEQAVRCESFKVRRKETPAADPLANAQDAVGETIYFVGADGAEYNLDGWSYSDKLNADEPVKREFDPCKEVTRKTNVYAHYFANLGDVNDARKKLEAAVKAAISLSDDHFLKVEESRKLKQFIATAQAVLDDPRTVEEDLNQAFNDLETGIAPYRVTLDDRYDHYEDIQSGSHSGGSHGGGGGGAGTKKEPFNNISPDDYQIGTNGNWIETVGPAGEKQLGFQLNGGSLLSGMWAKLEYPAGADTAGNGWYHFDSKGAMQTGWVCDPTGNWYYCNTEKDGHTGKMATDWKLDAGDGHLYYLDLVSGAMALGWRQIGGKWYYFSPIGGGTYAYDPAKETWTYGGGNGRPMGSMYKNETTPDGYQVGADGAWVQ